MSDEYNGWANRETWAFWLHVTNDQGWYEMVREFVASVASDVTGLDPVTQGDDYKLGSEVVEYVRETLEELMTGSTYDPQAQNPLVGMRDDIGSFWRIDYAEIGAAARELVSE